MNQRTPSIGTPAETADGKRLGVIAEVEGDYLRINPNDSDGSSFWLPATDIDQLTADLAQFDFDHSELDRHVVPVSPEDVEPEPNDRGPMDDELDQRKQMLADMAGDRREIRDDGHDMPDEGRTIGEPVEQELDRLAGGRSPDS